MNKQTLSLLLGSVFLGGSMAINSRVSSLLESAAHSNSHVESDSEFVSAGSFFASCNSGFVAPPVADLTYFISTNGEGLGGTGLSCPELSRSCVYSDSCVNKPKFLFSEDLETTPLPNRYFMEVVSNGTNPTPKYIVVYEG